MLNEEWYYLRDGDSRGPQNTDVLAALYHRGEVSRETLVWRLGAERWKPICEVLPEISKIPPPLPTIESAGTLLAQPRLVTTSTSPSLPDLTRDALSTGPSISAQQWTDTSAHPWRRYFARMLDTLTNGAIVIFIAAVALAFIAPERMKDFTSALDNKLLGTIAMCLAAMPLNALLIGLTGGSFGKWLFGVRVLTLDGRPIGFMQALSREGVVAVQGLGLGIPIVSLFTCVAAFNNLRKMAKTSWDAKAGFKAVHRPKGARLAIGMFFGLVAYVCVVLALAALGG